MHDALERFEPSARLKAMAVLSTHGLLQAYEDQANVRFSGSSSSSNDEEYMVPEQMQEQMQEALSQHVARKKRRRGERQEQS